VNNYGWDSMQVKYYVWQGESYRRVIGKGQHFLGELQQALKRKKAYEAFQNRIISICLYIL
jgi:hypothetical protein